MECVGGVHCLETGAVHIRQFPLSTALTLLPLDNHDDDTHADDDGQDVVMSKDEDNFYFDEGEVHYHAHLLAQCTCSPLEDVMTNRTAENESVYIF